MYVPPAIRVTLGCAEGGRLARFARVTDPRHGRRIEAVARECEGHTGIPTTKAARRQLHELLDLGVKDTVTFIKEIAAPLTEAMDNRECLARNAAALAQTKSPYTPNKLRSKDVRVLKYRIRSLLHLLSPQDTAMLACALAHLDSRLGIMARPLIKHYIRALEDDTAHSINPGDTVVSLALMLTSLEMFVRTHSQQLKQVAEGGPSERDNDAEWAANDETSGDIVTEAGNYACNVTLRESIGEPLPGEVDVDEDEVPLTVHDKFHYGAIMTTMLADCLKANEVNDVELMLLLAQCMGNISVPAALPSELVVQKVDLRDLDDNQLCKFTHACASIMTLHHVNLDGVIEASMKEMAERTKAECVQMSAANVAQAFHAFYLTGKLDCHLMSTLARNLVAAKACFSNSTDYYRVAIPLAITGQLSSEEICIWVLNQLAFNAEEYTKDTSHFLFLLTTIANSIKVAWKRRTKLPLKAVALETDIYEKAETDLRHQEGEKHYFPSPRSAVLFLIDRANALIKRSSSDEFVQIMLLNCVKSFKPDSRVKFELLNECKRRVNEISCGGIPQVLQTLFTLFSPNAPELVEALVLYLERVLAEITLHNDPGVLQIEGSRLFEISFLQDVNILGNVLSIFDRCNLNRGDLATQVAEMLERSNFQQLEGASVQALIDLLHYIAFSVDRHEAIDVMAILLQQKLEGGAQVSSGQLAAIAECFVAAPMTLNPLRHQGLIQAIKQKANSSSGDAKALQAILKRIDWRRDAAGTPPGDE